MARMQFALQDWDGHTYATAEAETLQDGFRVVYRQYCESLAQFDWFDKQRFNDRPLQIGEPVPWNSRHEAYPGPLPFGIYDIAYVFRPIRNAPRQEVGNRFYVAVRPVAEAAQ
jgi:hypothetical protein